MIDIEDFKKSIGKKSRLLGIDPGKKRIGLAISDEDKLVSTPLKTIIKKKNSNFINGGVYKFNNFFLKKLIKKNISLENDIIPDLINKKLVKGMIFKNFFLDIGTPRNFLSARKKLIKYTTKPALFLDRDNTLIHDHGYIYKTKDLKLKKTFIKYLKKIALKKIYIFIVTNQSGIGRGYFTERQFENFQLNLKKKIVFFKYIFR